MALVITNGTYYIATNEHGGIIKTLKMEDAQQFYNVNVAMKKIRKAPGKCKGYYVFDTDGDDKPSTGKKTKRKKYSEQERKMIYIRDDGRCALCGRKITLSEMTIDHIVPLDKNGEDSINNLQSACLACNRFKANIRPDDFMDRITTIFIYQMGKKYGGKISWKIAYKALENII